MLTFTFIADYMGGTYLSQVLSDNVENAIRVWAAGLRETDLGDLRDRQLEHARGELLHDIPIPLTGLTSVWCISTLIDDHLLLVHIVEGKQL
jgi:hypothetical protein